MLLCGLLVVSTARPTDRPNGWMNETAETVETDEQKKMSRVGSRAGTVASYTGSHAGGAPSPCSIESGSFWGAGGSYANSPTRETDSSSLERSTRGSSFGSSDSRMVKVMDGWTDGTLVLSRRLAPSVRCVHGAGLFVFRVCVFLCGVFSSFVVFLRFCALLFFVILFFCSLWEGRLII